MKALLKILAVVGVLAIATSHVAAQTSANGSYYALPSWDQQIPAAQRFIVLANWNNEAVLDRETGLVWQRVPQVTTRTSLWSPAFFDCWEAQTGGRKGWRLPTPEELGSLIDPTQANPALPAGHPFQQLNSIVYWSSTSLFPPTPTTPGVAISVFIDDGQPASGSTAAALAGVWCVRGGSHVVSDFVSTGP